MDETDQIDSFEGFEIPQTSSCRSPQPPGVTQTNHQKLRHSQASREKVVKKQVVSLPDIKEESPAFRHTGEKSDGTFGLTGTTSINIPTTSRQKEEFRLPRTIRLPPIEKKSRIRNLTVAEKKKFSACEQRWQPGLSTLDSDPYRSTFTPYDLLPPIVSLQKSSSMRQRSPTVPIQVVPEPEHKSSVHHRTSTLPPESTTSNSSGGLLVFRKRSPQRSYHPLAPSPPVLPSSSSSSSSFSPTHRAREGKYLHYPSPPTESLKNNNHTRPSRPGRRLVPLRKPAPNISGSASHIAIIPISSDERSSKITFPLQQEIVKMPDEERQIFSEYRRLRPGRRQAVCEELEKCMNIVKINGQRFDLGALRNELNVAINIAKQ